MNKYLATVGDCRGEWASGDLIEAYVFEADNHKAAMRVMASYLKGKTGFHLLSLGRITSGLQVEKIDIREKAQSFDVVELSREQEWEIGFDRLSASEEMIAQLQPFDPNVRSARLEAIEAAKAKRARAAAMPIPKIGDDIYVPTALHLSRGRDDVIGGLARVKSVLGQKSHGEQVHFISVEEIPESFNWEQHLALMQDDLKKEFGENRAYPHPDDRPEFNEI